MAVRLKSPLEVAACVAAKEVKCIVMFDREVVHSRRVGKNLKKAHLLTQYSRTHLLAIFQMRATAADAFGLAAAPLAAFSSARIASFLRAFARASCASPARLKAISASGAWQRSGCPRSSLPSTPV